jgi:hypothetical protein
MDVNTENTTPSPAVIALKIAIDTRIQHRRDEALANGKKSLAAKWAVEQRYLTALKPVEALVEAKFDPTSLDQLAIYAAQKVRRLVQAYLGVGTVDPYTQVILTNAKALQNEEGKITNRTVTASLSTKIRSTEKLPVRRVSAVETATTQASSTRMALVALGAGVVASRGKDATFQVDFTHPFVARALGDAA